MGETFNRELNRRDENAKKVVEKGTSTTIMD
jgi:hypothetical protein